MFRRPRLNLTPVIARALRAIGASEDFRAAAVRSRMIAPEDETEVAPAVFLDGELERIRATHGETALDVELDRLRGGRIRHAATSAHVLRGARWSSGHAYARGAHHRATDSRPPLWSHEVEAIERAAVASTYYGGRFFGHWLTDDVPLAMVASRIAEPIVPPRPSTAHQRQYLELFGLSPRPLAEAWVRELTILDDVGANASKRARWRWMRTHVRALGATEGGPEGVMLLRGAIGASRRLLNEAEVAAHLERRGFAILEPEMLTVAELARAMTGARIVLGVEGSQLLHGAFAMADRGAIVTLQPPDQLITIIKIYCDALGLRYSLVVGEGSADGFHVDVDRVARTVDLALAACARD